MHFQGDPDDKELVQATAQKMMELIRSLAAESKAHVLQSLPAADSWGNKNETKPASTGFAVCYWFFAFYVKGDIHDQKHFYELFTS